MLHLFLTSMSNLFPVCVFICEFFGIGFDLNSIFEVKKEWRIAVRGLLKKSFGKKAMKGLDSWRHTLLRMLLRWTGNHLW